jgi:CubicO group peptidase (beta-lactamase class C family)
MKFAAIAAVVLLVAAPAVSAAPDEERLGKASAYPIGNASNWYYDESVRVGSFTHQAEIPGIFRGKSNVLKRADVPMPLASAAREPAYRWSVDQARDLTVDDFLARQRIMGLLIVKDGVIQVERYQYDRKPTDRFTSQSMARSIAALAIGFALEEGKIKSLDDRAEQYAAKLRAFLIEATDWKQAPEQFRPGKATPSLGYGYQFWTYPGQTRRFAMLGVYGQSIFVDPGQRLVVVQTAANETAQAGDTSLARERDAFWRGVMRYYVT